MKTKNVYIIAGPNGAGKTTFARKFLPNYADCTNFINADLIAEGLSPFSPSIAAMKTGRLVLKEIRGLANNCVNFSFETTLSGKTYLALLRALKDRGYLIHLFFLWIPSPGLALERIRDRVAGGGHNVPAVDVRRRFYRSIENFFKAYRPLMDSWMLFDNSGEKPHLVAHEKEGELLIRDAALFGRISKENRNDD